MIQSDLFDPFKGLSDLQLGDEKGTLDHLVILLFRKLSRPGRNNLERLRWCSRQLAPGLGFEKEESTDNGFWTIKR